MSLLKDLADALAQGLAAQTWQFVDAQPSVQRVNWPTYAVEDMAGPVKPNVLDDAAELKAATPWVNVGGAWRRGSPKIRVGGAWKG